MKLKAWRQSKDLSQTTFADMIGAAQATVSDWERGASAPKAEAMRWVFVVTDGAVTPNDFVLTEA